MSEEVVCVCVCGITVLDSAESKSNAAHQCNYCFDDVSGTFRIECHECPDCELCIECFSINVEITRHKSSHSYQAINVGTQAFWQWNAQCNLLWPQACTTIPILLGFHLCDNMYLLIYRCYIQIKSEGGDFFFLPLCSHVMREARSRRPSLWSAVFAG